MADRSLRRAYVTLFAAILFTVLVVVAVQYQKRKKQPAPQTTTSEGVSESVPEWKSSGTHLFKQRQQEQQQQQAQLQALLEKPVLQPVHTEADDETSAPVSENPVAGMTREERIRYVQSLPEYKESWRQYNALRKQRDEILFGPMRYYDRLLMSLLKGEPKNPKVISDKDMAVLTSMWNDGELSDEQYQKFQQMYQQREENKEIVKTYKEHVAYIEEIVREYGGQLSELSYTMEALTRKRAEMMHAYGVE